MNKINPPNPEAEIQALRMKVTELETKLKEAQENVAHFKHKYFKAAKLGERITSSEPISDN